MRGAGVSALPWCPPYAVPYFWVPQAQHARPVTHPPREKPSRSGTGLGAVSRSASPLVRESSLPLGPAGGTCCSRENRGSPAMLRGGLRNGCCAAVPSLASLIGHCEGDCAHRMVSGIPNPDRPRASQRSRRRPQRPHNVSAWSRRTGRQQPAERTGRGGDVCVGEGKRNSEPSNMEPERDREQGKDTAATRVKAMGDDGRRPETRNAKPATRNPQGETRKGRCEALVRAAWPKLCVSEVATGHAGDASEFSLDEGGRTS